MFRGTINSQGVSEVGIWEAHLSAFSPLRMEMLRLLTRSGDPRNRRPSRVSPASCSSHLGWHLPPPRPGDNFSLEASLQTLRKRWISLLTLMDALRWGMCPRRKLQASNVGAPK
jgi:hypothetical protein